MKDFFKNLGKYQTVVIFFSVTFLFLGLINHAESYYGYGSPTWNSDFNFGWGGPNNYFNYNSYQDYSNPYMYGPAMGVYYPYNTMFDVYNGGYAMNAGYNQNFMGFYNSGNYSGSEQQDINAIGYPIPYGLVDQRQWNTQLNTTSGFLGLPPMTTNYTNAGNPYNIYYDPVAFTFDLGLEASWGGIMNFWTGFFKNLNEDDDND